MRMRRILIVTMALSLCSVWAQAPTAGVSAPTFTAANVKSMFSNTYSNVNVTTWLTNWSSGLLKDTNIGSNDMKRYSNLDFVGIETTGSNLMDISGMTYLHIDFWTSNATTFRVKLVDFGADKNFGGGDDTEHEVVYTSPAQNQWVRWHIPLSSFTNLSGKMNIAQMIFSALPAGSTTVYVDNILYTTEAQTNGPSAPSTAAKTPTVKAPSVISLFSNAYTNVSVNTWRTNWSAADLKDTTIASDDMKRYTNLDYVGVETVGANLINASTMKYLHIDFWTNNAGTFRVKLVDFGADKNFGGGDDTEHELASTTHATGEWISWHIPLTAFTGLTNKSNIAQMIFSALPAGSSNVFIDNVFFTTEDSKNPLYGPTTAAPAPTLPASQVISLFCKIYPNKKVDTWRTPWSSAKFNDTVIASDSMKHYGKLDFVGIEATGTNMLNVSAMTHFNVNFWTTNATTFRVKLVDWGANGAFGGGDDTEHETVSTTHGLNQWVTWSIPFSSMTGLTSRSKIAQIIFSGLPTGEADVYVDNIYFSTNQGGVSKINNNASFKIFPNPATKTLNVVSINQSKFENIEIVDAAGRVVLQTNATANAIDISTLKPGIYNIKCTSKAGVESSSFIVQ